MKKIVLLVFVSVCSLLLSILAQFVVPLKTEPRTIYVDAKNTGFEDGSKEHPYNTIKEGINAATPGDGVFVYNGTYQEWNIVLDKDNLSLIGENKDNTIIDGRGLGSTLRINNARSVTMTGFTIRNSPGSVGIWLYYSTGSNISNNIITKCDSGIYSVFSNGNVIENNRVSDNYAGIILSSFCKENRISNNDVIGNTYGIALSHNNRQNEVENNKIVQNTYGISISFNNGSIFGNQIIDNDVGIYEDLYVGPAQGYRIFHNNLINNTIQAQVTSNRNNTWDNSYPSGGNYWSDYIDVDNNSGPYQNVTDVPDGMWDHPYTISANNTDRYPLSSLYDDTPPTIGIPSRTPSGDILPNQEVTIAANVTDNLTGVKNVTLYYTIDDELDWNNTEMLKPPITGFYEATVPGQEYGTTVKFKIEAFDNAGNNKIINGAESYCIYQVVPEFLTGGLLLLILIVLTVATAIYKRRLLKTPIH